MSQKKISNNKNFVNNNIINIMNQNNNNNMNIQNMIQQYNNNSNKLIFEDD